MDRTTTSPELRPTRSWTSRPSDRRRSSEYRRTASCRLEGRVAGPHGVILLGHRGAEERHDAVAHDLVDGALVAMNGLHHALEDGVEEPPRLLGIAVGEQFHRALQIGEEHGDLLALAFEGGLGGEDLLGEMLWRVALRRAESRTRHCRLGLGSAEPLTALLAELGPRLVCRAATRAGSLEPSPTLLAEHGIAGVFLLASGTRHGRGGSPPP